MNKLSKIIFGTLYFIIVMILPAGIIHSILNSNLNQILTTITIMTIGIFAGRGLHKFAEYASGRYKDDTNRIFLLVSVFYMLITTLVLTVFNLI